MAELMIVGKDKNVGGTSLNADAASSVVTTAIGTDSQTEETGRIKTKDPKHEAFGAVVGNVFKPAAAGSPRDSFSCTAAVAYKQTRSRRAISPSAEPLTLPTTWPA